MKVVIIGGGLAGLTTAYYLSKYTDYTIELYEAEESLGGRVRTIDIDGFKFNYGAFMVFTWYKEYKKLMLDLGLNLKEELEQLDGQHEYAWDETTRSFHEINQHWVFDDLPVQTLIKTLPTILTHNSELYLPDPNRFNGMSVSDFFKKTDRTTSRDLDVINKIAVGYTYGAIFELPLSIYFGFAKEILLNKGFKNVSAIKDGANKVIELLEKDIKNNGVVIKTSSKATVDKNKNVSLGGKSITFDYLVIANGSEDLLQPLIPNVKKPIQYNDHYVACLETEHKTTVCENTGWNILYTASMDEDVPQLTSIGNFEATFPEHPSKKLITYLRVPNNLRHSFTRKDAQNEIVSLTKKYLPDSGDITIKYLHHWDHTMPQITLETLSVLQKIQGNSGVYFAGDYLGAPSMEVAVVSGKKVAQEIISKS